MQIISEDRIDFLDERFYQFKFKEVMYFPSVTYVLGEGYHKGHGFEQFLKDHGENSRVVADRAAEGGTLVHDYIHRLNLGEEHDWTTPIHQSLKYHGEYLTKEEWIAILKYEEFFRTCVSKVIACEHILRSKKYRIAGTADLICQMGGENWLIDYKFSNAIYESHELQVAAYAYMWNTMYPKNRITRVGILHLKADTRGEDKKGKKIQGRGWKLHEPEMTLPELWGAFLNVLCVFRFKQSKGLLPTIPSLLSLPRKIKLIIP